MGNLELLKTAISESGLTVAAVARKAGIEQHTMYNRLKNMGKFQASEIQGIVEVLRLSNKQKEDIFFSL